MRELISKLFGFRSSSPTVHATQPDISVSRLMEDTPATIEDGSDNALRRQLVQVLLRDVLHRHGIPVQLVVCQMLVVTSRSRGAGIYIRLVLKQWDERLVRYAFAFQKALKAEILRFEPHAAEWLHGVSWQFEFGESCPYAELPDKSFWEVAPDRPATTDLMPSRPTAAEIRQTEEREDLDLLFAIRDRELARQIDVDADAARVELKKAQPGSL